jgi:hypothetical protein
MQRDKSQFRAKALKIAAQAAVGSLLLSPVLFPAFAAQIVGNDSDSTASDWLTHFTPAGVDSRLAEKMRNNAMRQTAFPFTPAGLTDRGSNVLTVAVRTDGGNAVNVRNALAQMDAGAGTSISLNSSFQLSASRGWQGFKLPATSAEQPRLETMLGKGNFSLNDATPKKPSRFNTDVKVQTPRGSVPSLRGTEAAAGDYRVDVGGSFRVAKGVDVTAGVRYSRDSDRVEPSADNRADSEAVYVGTKIKF